LVYRKYSNVFHLFSAASDYQEITAELNDRHLLACGHWSNSENVFVPSDNSTESRAPSPERFQTSQEIHVLNYLNEATTFSH
jgi:hypothetical protein